MEDTKKKAGPMQVVAKNPGFYNAIRKPGARFVIADGETAFSKNWMLDPEDPADREEAESLMKAYDLAAATVERGASDKAIQAEIAQAQGLMPALREENDQLKRELAALKAKMEGTEDAGESEEEEPAAAEPAAAEPAAAEPEAGAAASGDQAGPARRRTRR